MLARDNGYIKFFYPIKESELNLDLFYGVKKESALRARNLVNQSEDGVVDLFDKVAITEDNLLSFESSLDDCFDLVGDIFKKYGLDYYSFIDGEFPIVNKVTEDIGEGETEELVEVYEIMALDRGSVKTSTLKYIDAAILRYLIYCLTNNTEYYMNANKYLDLSEIVAASALVIENRMYPISIQGSTTSNPRPLAPRMPIKIDATEDGASIPFIRDARFVFQVFVDDRLQGDMVQTDIEIQGIKYYDGSEILIFYSA